MTSTKLSYLRILMQNAIRLIWGNLRFLSFKKVRISPTVTIVGSSYFKFKSNLSIEPHCYINSIGLEGIQVGKNVIIGRNTTIIVSPSLKNLGRGLFVGNNTSLGTNGFYGCAGGG